MKIAICDDERVFREHLKDKLNRYYKSLDMLVESFSSGEELLKKYRLNPNAYDIVFLDIEMDKLDGISTAKLIREQNLDILIIFLTSHVEFALDGYEVEAFRFLTKPLNEKKLIAALQDAQCAMDRNRKILIKELDKEILLQYRDIVYLEAQNVNVRIKTLNAEYVIRKTLVQVESEIKGPVFYKPHRSYIINLEYVSNYSSKEITMDTGQNIPLSRNKSSEFKEALMMYVKTCGV